MEDDKTGRVWHEYGSYELVQNVGHKASRKETIWKT
jgi:hypothetical protein